MNIILPYNFKPRPYQYETFLARFKDGYRNFVDIEHRRAGKDTKWLNIMIAETQRRVGTYLYTLPTLSQAKKVIWRGINKDGLSFLDYIPPALIKSKNQSELSITFKNGSILRLGGADYYDSWMGTNPLGIVFSEYQLQDPQAAQYFKPILVENGGWQAYCYTPRGRNHGYYLWDKNRANDNWFCQLLTIDQTCDEKGDRIIKKCDIEELHKGGMSEELINQEFYCSFDAAVEGAYFANALRHLRENEKILDFSVDINFPVNTYWDIGTRDKTAIWFIQIIQKTNEYRIINYYENFNEGPQHYINYINEWKSKTGICYGTHYAPHDIMKREYTTNKSIMGTVRQLGLNFSPVPRIPHKEDGIAAVRCILPRCIFHEKNCEKGLGALLSYHARFNEKKNYYSDPEHDWSSHSADAFMQFAQQEGGVKTEKGRILFNRVNTNNPFDHYTTSVVKMP